MVTGSAVLCEASLRLHLMTVKATQVTARLSLAVLMSHSVQVSSVTRPTLQAPSEGPWPYTGLLFSGKTVRIPGWELLLTLSTRGVENISQWGMGWTGPGGRKCPPQAHLVSGTISKVPVLKL